MISCKRSKFTLPKKVTYLNCAYMSPLLKTVEKVGIKNLRRKRNPSSISAEDFFTDGELLRVEFARLINAGDPKRIAIIPSVSYGMANVAMNLKISRGEKIIVAAEQFPSNYYPWQRLCLETGATLDVVEPPKDLLQRGMKWNEKILSAIDKNTKAVAIGNVHWADGTLFQLEEIRKRTNDVGALLIVDGTQSVGVLPFDVAKIQPDALVCAGYKWLLGPYSIGVAYYGEYFDGGRPIEESWLNRVDSEDFSALVNYQASYQPGALRYDVGEHSNFVYVPMLLRSIAQLNQWGVANVQEYIKSISGPAIDSLKEKGYWVEDEDSRGGHLFGLRLLKHNPQKIKEVLHRNNIFVSIRGDAIRVAPNVYNDTRDLAKLVKALSL
ncbi:MAG TPA: aminotransferase class V-fold PLP-dependent enzyme [Chryseolinea sp.]